ncbi:hypothetical protein P9112_007102 [Eukaryota sp. TZLM1-RC]
MTLPSAYLGIELGGTTTVVALCTDLEAITFETRDEFDTSSPQEVFARIKDFVRDWSIKAIGVAAFGPVIIDPLDPLYGTITTTPKVTFQNCSLIEHLSPICKNIFIDTDVNAAAIAEHKIRLQKGKDVPLLKYITVGTGIGIGSSSCPPIPSFNAEGGHIMTPLFEEDVTAGFSGICPYHSSCVEGMTSSLALAKRAGIESWQLPHADDCVFDAAVHYLAHLCINSVLLNRPNVIVLGGGVMKREGLYERIIKKFDDLMNGYLTGVKGSDVLQQQLLESGIVGSFMIIN